GGRWGWGSVGARWLGGRGLLGRAPAPARARAPARLRGGRLGMLRPDLRNLGMLRSGVRRLGVLLFGWLGVLRFGRDRRRLLHRCSQFGAVGRGRVRLGWRAGLLDQCGLAVLVCRRLGHLGIGLAQLAAAPAPAPSAAPAGIPLLLNLLGQYSFALVRDLRLLLLAGERFRC